MSGALEVGAQMAILVKTDTYRRGDKVRLAMRPSAVVDGIGEAVEVVLRGVVWLIVSKTEIPN